MVLSKEHVWHVDQVHSRGVEQVRKWYSRFSVKASACVECGECLARCPFGVDIVARMREAAALFENAG